MNTDIHNGLVLQFGSYAEQYLKDIDSELKRNKWEKDNTESSHMVKQNLKYTPKINRYCGPGWKQYLKKRKVRNERHRANIDPECIPLYKAYYSNTGWM